MAITTGDESTWEKWERIIKEQTPGFLKNRKQHLDKKIDPPKKKKKKK